MIPEIANPASTMPAIRAALGRLARIRRRRGRPGDFRVCGQDHPRAKDE
jgi:hypothetical protein